MSFLRFRPGTLNASLRFALFGRGASAGTDIGSSLALPYAATLEEMTIVAPSAPGAGKSYTRQLKVNGAATGPVVQLRDSAVSVRETLNVAVAALVEHLVVQGSSGNPPAAILHDVYRYHVDFPNEDVSFYGAGDSSSNLVLAGTNRYFGLNGSGTNESGTNESAVQVDWPVAGTFVGMAAIIGVSASTSAQVVLRKNGSDTPLALTASGAASAVYAELTQTVDVAAGDLVNFRYVRTAGTGTVFACGLVLAFHGAY